MLFINKSREAGFTVKEAEVLRRLAVYSGFDEAVSIFSQADRLDTCIRLLIQEIKVSPEKNDANESQDLLFKMYDYRQKMEVSGTMDKKGISNSLQIKNGQALKIFLAGSGVFKSQLVKNTNGYMTISRPVNASKSTAKEWRGQKISVYFWMEDDAGYVFDTDVKDEVYSLGIFSLKVSHSFSLSRTQKRKSVRAKVALPAFMYLVNEGEPYHKIESTPGLKCMIEDISDTGCAVTVGGKASSGLRVKIQFELNGTAICMSGTVRSAIYRKDADRSILHIESDPLPTDVRNQLLGKVFGTFEEDDDDLPFRILDDEAVNAAENGIQGNMLRDLAPMPSNTKEGKSVGVSMAAD
ncbi:MAG: PilZ domain-containing protein [Treponema sp.]|nr:PilZ domain-containing protein [Treponema sp.]